MRVISVSLLARLGAATAASAIAVTGVVASAGAADAATQVKKLPTAISVRKVNHPRHHYDALHARLRSHHAPLRNKVVYLERKTATTTFTVVAHKTTNRHGRVVFRVSPAVPSAFKIVFNGTPNFQPSHSRIVLTARTHAPRAKTSLSIRKVNHPVLGYDTISGVLKSHGKAISNRRVYLERRAAGTTTFTVLRHKRTGPHGGVAFRVSRAIKGAYKLVFHKHPHYRASHSGIVHVR